MPSFSRFAGASETAIMGDYIGLGAIVIVALSPLLRRLYIDRFWIHARGTIIRLEGGINYNPGAGGAWAWTPIVEYQAAGQRLSARIFYWQRFNAKPQYAVGDEMDILYDPRNPSRVMLDSWATYIVLTIVLSGFLYAGLLHPR